MFRLGGIVLSLYLLLSGCGETPPPFPLEGAWQAGSLSVGDSLWLVETSPIKLFLDEQDGYTLQWYGREGEEGEWSLDYPHLLIRPHDKEPRSLEITYLDSDSLELQGLLDSNTIRLGFRRRADEPRPSE